MRILGITIPDNKQLQYGLTAIYGIGLSRAQSILDKVGVSYTTKATEVSTETENEIRKIVESFLVEGALKRSISQNIKRLKDIRAYRGLRHSYNLPVRGQRTKTNSRTVRGNKRNTMASGRVKVSKT